MGGQFSALARYYDRLNYNADYARVADYIERVFALYGSEPGLVLDLACGTGALTVELARRGYDMIGLDISADMLGVASAKGSPDILWLNQDMCGFELYGTVDAVVCCYDSLNYILDEGGLERCFGLVHNYLNPGGLFLFDVNSEHKFENIYGGNDIILENDGVLCAWRNSYDRQSGICEFDISIFARDGAGYKRYDEIQRERYYSAEQLAGIAGLAGFTDLRLFYDFGAAAKEGHERVCFSAVKK